MTTTRKLGLLTALIAGSVVQMNAALVGWDFTTVSTRNINGGFSLGQVFVPTADFTLDFLGYYGTAGSFTESHDVAIYDASGTLLSSTTIDNSSGFAGAGFAFNPVAPITLFAGQTYVIDGASGVVDPYVYDESSFTLVAPITLTGFNFTAGSNDNFTGTATTTVAGVPEGYFGPNFGWDPGVVSPEPASLLLVGTALLGAGILRRRKSAV